MVNKVDFDGSRISNLEFFVLEYGGFQKHEGFPLICCKLLCNPCFLSDELIQKVDGDLLSSRVFVLCGLLFLSLFDCFLINRRFY